MTFPSGTVGFIYSSGKSSVYLGKLSEQVRIWLLTFLDGTCIQMSSVSFDNATLDYILVIWVCMVEVTSLFPEYLPGTQGILAYLLETNVSFGFSVCV